MNYCTLDMVVVFEIGRLNLGVTASLAMALSAVLGVSTVVVVGAEKAIKRWLLANFQLFDRRHLAVVATTD